MPSGTGGYIDFGAGRTLDVTQWEGNKEIEVQDVTDTGDGGWRSREGTVKSMSGSFSIVFDPTYLLEADLTMDVGDQATATLRCGGTGKFYRGPMLLTSIRTINNAQGDVVRQDANWQSTGAWINPVT